MAIHWHLNYEGKGIHVCASYGVSQSWIAFWSVIYQICSLSFEKIIVWTNCEKLVNFGLKRVRKIRYNINNCFRGVSGSLLILLLLFTMVRFYLCDCDDILQLYTLSKGNMKNALPNVRKLWRLGGNRGPTSPSLPSECWSDYNHVFHSE